MRMVMAAIFILATAATGPALAQQPQAPPPSYGAPIGLEEARRVVAAALEEARRQNWTVAVAVVDAGGHLVSYKRIDGTQWASGDVAIAKARSAVAYRRPTKAFEEVVAGGRTVILALPHALPIEGGLPISREGRMVGAIGVSGVTSQQDGVVAAAGAAALR